MIPLISAVIFINPYDLEISDFYEVDMAELSRILNQIKGGESNVLVVQVN